MCSSGHYGQIYSVSHILDSGNRFILTYEKYSPLYLPTMTYFFVFTLLTCVLIHMILYHTHSLWKGVKKIRIVPQTTVNLLVQIILGSPLARNPLANMVGSLTC